MDWRERLLQQATGIAGGAENHQAAPMAAPFGAGARGGGGRAAALRSDVFGARSYADAMASADGACMRCDSAPDLARVYGRSSKPPRRPMSRPSSATMERGLPASHARLRVLEVKDDAAYRTPTGSFLRLCGLGQYAFHFFDAGLTCLYELGRLQDGEVIDVLEGMQLYPGHKAKLLRAVTTLRQAAILGGREQPGRTRDELLMEKLCERNDLLVQQRDEQEAQCRVLQEENHRVMLEMERYRGHVQRLEELANAQATELADLSSELRQLVGTARVKESECPHEAPTPESNTVAELEKARARVTDLEGMVWNQAEQVKFLASQLQHFVGGGQPPATATPAATATADETKPDGSHAACSTEPAPVPLSTSGEPPSREATALPEEPVEALPIRAAATRARPASASLRGRARRGGQQDSVQAEVHHRTAPSSKLNPACSTAGTIALQAAQPRPSSAAATSSTSQPRPRPNAESLKIRDWSALDRGNRSTALFQAASGDEGGAHSAASESRSSGCSSRCSAGITDGRTCGHCHQDQAGGTRSERDDEAETTRFPSSRSSAPTSSGAAEPEQAAACLAAAIENKLRLAAARQTPRMRHGRFAIFLEPDDTAARAREKPVPESHEIFEFVSNVIAGFGLCAEVVILALVYTSRLQETCGLAVRRKSWRRITFTALLVAMRIWDKDAASNASITNIAPMFSLAEVIELESIFVQSLGDALLVNEADCSAARFLLQTLGRGHCAGLSLPRISPEKALKLEQRASLVLRNVCDMQN